MSIEMADGLVLGDGAAAQVYALLGRRGSGKTYAAGRFAEGLLGSGEQVVILDPVGVWWGLRLARDGTSPGIPIPIFGGQHGDIPLEATGGKLVAQLVASKSLCVVLDVSDFTGADQRRFVADFAQELLHAKKSARSAVMVIMEEAQEFAPQLVRPDHAKMVGAIEKLVKLGRNFGVGTAMISQRPQAVNKDILNQAEVLFAFQLTGPQERKAIDGWVQEHWQGQVGKCERAILDALVSYGAQSKVELASWAGYEASGGGFNNALSRLRTLELITRGDPIAFHPDFAEALR